MKAEDRRKHAKNLAEPSLWLIEQILIKHNMTVIEEVGGALERAKLPPSSTAREDQEQKDLAELRPCYGVTGLEKFIEKYHPSYKLVPLAAPIADFPDIKKHAPGRYSKITERLTNGDPIRFTNALDNFTADELNAIASDLRKNQ